MAVGPSPDLSGNLPTDECCIDNECCEDSIECPETEPVGSRPASFVYVASENNLVSILDSSTNNVVGSMVFPTGTTLYYWAALPDGAKLYLTFLDSTSAGVFVIDPRSNVVIKTIRLPTRTTLWGIAVSPDGRTVYFTDYDQDRLYFIDTATDTLDGSIAVGGGPMGVAFTPNGEKAYVCNEVEAQSVANHYGTVSVIDTASRSVVASIDMPTRFVTATEYDADTHYVAFSPDGTRAYVTNGFSHTLTMVDTATDTILKSLELGVGGWELTVVVSPNGQWGYVGNDSGNEIAIIDLQEWVVTVRIPIIRPSDIALSPDGSRIYATSYNFANQENVFVIDAVSHQVIAVRTPGNLIWGAIALPPPPVTGPQCPRA